MGAGFKVRLQDEAARTDPKRFGGVARTPPPFFLQELFNFHGDFGENLDSSHVFAQN